MLVDLVSVSTTEPAKEEQSSPTNSLFTAIKHDVDCTNSPVDKSFGDRGTPNLAAIVHEEKSMLLGPSIRELRQGL
jgi:hypothetical protein